MLLIAFGPRYMGEAWLKETGVSFPLLFDPERQVYQAYQLERSLLRSWNLNTIWTYIRLLASGRKWRGIKGDSAQLGADFVIDREAVIWSAHYSRDPTDRPCPQQILDILQRLQSQ